MGVLVAYSVKRNKSNVYLIDGLLKDIDCYQSFIVIHAISIDNNRAKRYTKRYYNGVNVIVWCIL